MISANKYDDVILIVSDDARNVSEDSAIMGAANVVSYGRSSTCP